MTGAPPTLALRTDNDPVARYRVCFLFTAQRHQMLHGVTVAAALARLDDMDVHVVATSPANLAYARRAIEAFDAAPITYSVAAPRLAAASGRLGMATPPKMLALLALVPMLRRFDAIAVPERTSLWLKRLGVRRPSFIHLDHGAGDRAISADPRIRAFDFVLLAGEKQRERFARAGLIRTGAHAIVGYPKFEAADAVRQSRRPFANDRPTVLYNPHFGDLGSWLRFGVQLVAQFAADERYNLVVAPHIRMCDNAGRHRRVAADLARFAGCPNILVDLGSDRSVDMTYTDLADVYVGDVSSQIYEFIRRPRPALFLDPHAVAWRDNEDYAHWQMGPVVGKVDGIIAAIDRARSDFGRYEPVQRARFASTFDLSEGSSTRSAAAIGKHLAARRTATPAGTAKPRPSPLPRAAAI